jgi:hypothetical protein
MEDLDKIQEHIWYRDINIHLLRHNIEIFKEKLNEFQKDIFPPQSKLISALDKFFFDCCIQDDDDLLKFVCEFFDIDNQPKLYNLLPKYIEFLCFKASDPCEGIQSTKIFKYLIEEKKIDPNSSVDLLSYACDHECEEIAKILIRNFAFIDESVLNDCTLEWKKYLPDWSTKIHNKFPKEIKKIIFSWLCVSRKLNPRIPKDICLMICQYIFDSWKEIW